MKTAFKNFEITAQLFSAGEFFPNSEDNGRHNQYQVFVNTEEGGASFYFYDSTANYEIGIQELDESSLLNAFSCFVSDAMTGRMEFEEFCGDFGYDTDSRRAYAIWESCKTSLDDFEGFELTSDEHHDLINELSELV